VLSQRLKLAVMFIATPRRQRSQYMYRTVCRQYSSEFCVHCYAVVEARNALSSRPM